jgi:MFS family permease
MGAMMDSQRFYELMLSNTAMGIAIVLTIAAVAISQRRLVGALFEEIDHLWRGMLWATTVSVGVLIAWITVADDWLQLVTDPYRLAQKWESQRVIFDPVSSDVRRITVGLIVLASILAAALFARYIGGYALQLAGLLVAVFGWFAMFIFRQRLDMIVNTIPSDDGGSILDLLGFLGFWVLRTSLGLVSIGVTWLVITLAVAPFVTLVLDLLRVRSPRITTEAKPFYAALERNAAGYDATPLAARWKPIRSR